MDDLVILKEPALEFRYGQRVVDPHDGLGLFGPYDTDTPSHPRNIAYCVIGTEYGVELFDDWSEHVMSEPSPLIETNRILWPPFPGFDAAFQSYWPIEPARTHILDEEKLIHSSQHKDASLKTSRIVDMYLEGISKFDMRDESLRIVICIVPDEVWKNCRPKSHIPGGWGTSPKKKVREMRAKGQQSILDDDSWTSSDYQYSIDFRRQIKARCMKYNIPIQIIRESTLVLGNKDERTKRRLTPLSDRAWNLSTAIYYKCGGKPWRLSTAREGVCYIGISFKRTGENEKSRTACCAAQMFLDSGDGIVFMGDEGPWYSPDNHNFHLSKEAARNLLAGILSSYVDLEGMTLKEIFLHSRSEISKEEFEGYSEACPKGVNIVGIRVRPDENLKIFREGTFPVLRGTFWRWNDRLAFLWAHGFKWRIKTYDGYFVPRPLRIDLMHGEADVTQISEDIFGLTKLNYNACRLGSSKPVTIEFSDAVGEILVSNPTVKERSRKFRYYI